MVCKPKKSAGLGVKHLELINEELFAQWRRRLKNEAEVIWYNILQVQYGDLATWSLNLNSSLNPNSFRTTMSRNVRYGGAISASLLVANLKAQVGSEKIFTHDLYPSFYGLAIYL